MHTVAGSPVVNDGAIERVAVIGSGVMGGGIAAQLANAGASVLLLDVAANDGPDRSAVARGAVERLSKSRPPSFMHRRAARQIDVGNIDDDLARAGEADWIVEAVVERLDVKRDLYARLDAVRRSGAIVTSNTSTIPLARLVEGASDALQRDFAITHFFNPPRYMRLLEIVRGPRPGRTTSNGSANSRTGGSARGWWSAGTRRGSSPTASGCTGCSAR